MKSKIRQLPKFHFAIPVWGESYVKTYLDYSLPTQLAPGNIPALKADETTYCLYTTAHDYELIAGSIPFKTLQSLITVNVVFIDDDLDSIKHCGAAGKYQLKSKCYRDALRRASQQSAALAALNCDMALANGFFSMASDLLSRGKRVIEVTGPRGLLEPIGSALNAYRSSLDGSISIEPAGLSALWVKFIHPQLKTHLVERVDGEPFHPSHLYWAVSDEGFVMRAFHLYPIIIDPRGHRIQFSSTIDNDLVGNLGLTDDEKFTAHDSRQMFCCELSSPDLDVGSPCLRGETSRYVDFYLSHSRYNIGNLKKEMLVTGVSILGPHWKMQREKSEAFTNVLLEALDEKIHDIEQRERKARRMRVAKRCLAQFTNVFQTTRPSPMENQAPISHPLYDKLMSEQATLAEGLALYQEMSALGQPFPLYLEEKVLLLGLAEEPKRQDLLARLRHVLLAQGKTVPPDVEYRVTELCANLSAFEENLHGNR